MADRDFKDLLRRRNSVKVSQDKVLKIAENPNYHGYQPGIPSMRFGKNSPVDTIRNKLNFEVTISRRITQTNFQKICKTKSILIFKIQYSGWWSSRDATIK